MNGISFPELCGNNHSSKEKKIHLIISILIEIGIIKAVKGWAYDNLIVCITTVLGMAWNIFIKNVICKATI